MSPLLRAYESESHLVQSACRELLLQAEDFEYPGEAAFRAWLYTAALHKLQKRERHLRAQKRARRAAARRDCRWWTERAVALLQPGVVAQPAAHCGGTGATTGGGVRRACRAHQGSDHAVAHRAALPGRARGADGP